MASSLIRLYQLSDGYCYNSDSLFLYDFAKRFLKHNHSLLDVGCGSGILAKLAQRDFNCEVTLIEKDKVMAYLAQKNLPHAQVICQDFLSWKSEERFDFVISNPPFYRSEILPSKNERINQARNESSLPLKEFLYRSKRLLKPNGTLILCYDARESHRLFYKLKSEGFNPEVTRFIYPRIDKEATLVMIKSKIQSKSSLKILPPLITHIGKNQKQNSQEVKDIYKECNTYSIKVYAQDIELNL